MKKPAEADRPERLKAALRDNLRRRKASGPQGDPGTSAPSGKDDERPPAHSNEPTG